MAQEVNIGYETGETCNREIYFVHLKEHCICDGIIEERPKEGSCSCHINPPCSYCVDDNHYCPVCGWDGLEE